MPMTPLYRSSANSQNTQRRLFAGRLLNVIVAVVALASVFLDDLTQLLFAFALVFALVLLRRRLSDGQQPVDSRP